jgi:hypothetical protein
LTALGEYATGVGVRFLFAFYVALRQCGKHVLRANLELLQIFRNFFEFF